MRFTALGIALAGAAILAVSAVGARRDAIPAAEQRVFRAVNRLPDWLYWPLWLPMQLGNLVVGTLAGIGVALARGDGKLAVQVVIAMASKLLVERLIRRRMSAPLEVRQRPGTSEPGAIRRGRDVPQSGPSFPSGHVILVAAVATVLSTDLPGAGIALVWALTALVMLGRVYVGAHNPLDVTAGLGAGMLVGGVVDAIFG